MVYASIKIKLEGTDYVLEMEGEAVYEQMSEGFIIDAANPVYHLNKEEKTEEELKEIFGDRHAEIMDALYGRAFDMPTLNEMSTYRKVH